MPGQLVTVPLLITRLYAVRRRDRCKERAGLSLHLSRRRKTVPAPVPASYGAAELSRRRPANVAKYEIVRLGCKNSKK